MYRNKVAHVDWKFNGQ